MIVVERAGPLMTVQDLGRPGLSAQGLSRGGAMDRMAVIEAAALLGGPAAAGIEMAGVGGVFRVTRPMRIALTGAAMQATLGDTPLRWHATHRVEPGQVLRIGGAQGGVYGYLTPAGGLGTPEWLGSRSVHLSAGLGRRLAEGDSLPVLPDPAPDMPTCRIEPQAHPDSIRVMDGPQTALFPDGVLDAFFSTTFIRSAQGNRQGVRLDADRDFSTAMAAGLASDVIGPGDLQMTGDGVPFVLMAECQTIGGYPRIGTILPADLPVIAQAAPGARLRFRRVTLAEASSTWQDDAMMLAAARRRVHPVLRDPRDVSDLLAYQLVGGVTRGDDLEEA